MAQSDSIPLKGALLLMVLLLPLGGCKREPREATDALGSSLLFDNASPEVREALASPVDFRINDDNFARWEEAQSNLEGLPRSALPTKSPAGGNAVDRAVARLESSPYTRTAIERTGLSVKEFVLETIALAQATEAARTGRSLSRGSIPPENFQFVQRYTSRALYSRSRVARGDAGNYDVNPDADVMSDQAENTDLQMRHDEAEHQADVRQDDMQRQREEVERAAELQREETDRESEMSREKAEANRERARDSVRDTLPTVRW
jgi:hypothetical protein